MSDSTIVIPFAKNGDKQTIPQAAQPTGSISYDQGYTVNYSDPGSSQYVERTGINEVLHTVTTHAKIVQDTGFDKWRDDIQYDINTFVWHNGSAWQKVSAGQGEPSGSSPWLQVKIDDLAPKNNPTLTGIVTVPNANSGTSAVNNDRMATYVGTQFDSPTVIFKGLVQTYGLTDNTTKPASTAWVRGQNYATINDVSLLSNSAMTNNATNIVDVPQAIGANQGYGINNIFPDRKSSKSEIKTVKYKVHNSGDTYIPGKSETLSIAARFGNPRGGEDPFAVMMEISRECQTVRFHSQLGLDSLTENRAYSQSYALLSRTRQAPLVDQVATLKTVADTETSILRLIKNFIAKTPAEFDKYNNDSRFRLVASSQDKNLRYVTDRAKVGTTIGSDDAIVVSHSHISTRIVGAGFYPSDGTSDAGRVPADGSWDYRKGRSVTTSVVGESGTGKNIPSSFCVALFEFIG